VIAVVGPTAAGKTALSLDLAERLGGEIVNTDAMQVYRGMDIGTAKLPYAERRGIPHHLLDILDIDQVATVSDFQVLARAKIDELRVAGKVPVLVGGSALYTRAVLDKFDFPGTDPVVRRRLEEELAEVGSGVLHKRLAELDPATARIMAPENGRRIVRALEVIELTGEVYGSTLPVLEYEVEGAHQIGVRIDRPTLDARIALRVDQMFEQGFVAEVERLMEQGLGQSVTARRAIGYADVVAMLAGDLSEAEAREKIATATRRFARKQDGWFLKDERVTWLDWDAPDLVDQAIATVSAAS
jgi:tRNA dimethylallyltransferase